ncbi:MerR family transcriptional regulator [Actinomadura sp. WAC 06369]|uniref:MerR family transcriptional regulator n=1 Tax=Actinomadura sp. WAC 06369 TaxID=2203193 RepID=UPI000F76C0B7|nr:MerR family transcriptional regulator [Actinomadura sp. WAC 06369]RSN71968.1 MerR family transcriptional regulator [Actinomadura sp. WAC 06369]
MSTMRISRLAERSGVPATTLRFYESAGLLPAERSPAGHRLYGEDAVDRLAFIGAAKRLGLPLEEVSELLGVRESGACADVKADLRPRVAARIADAEARAAELAAFTAALHRTLRHLDSLPDRPGPCDAGCGFPAGEARAPHPVDASSRPRRRVPEGAGGRRRSAQVACSLDGGDLAARIARWRGLTDGAARRETDGGIRFTLPAGRAADVAALAAAEQRCCPFIGFRLELDGPELHLEVRAEGEGAAMLTDLFGPGT